MDGIIADLAAICDLADRYDALVMVDDSHAVGLPRASTAAARPSYRGVMGRVDILTGTLGKALGGASGGYTSGRGEIVDCCASGRGPTCSPTPLAPADRGGLAQGARPPQRLDRAARPAEANTRSSASG